jgi:hypothetical protein
MPIQTAADSISNSAGSPYGFKNRVINGGMVIDQRNAGANVTLTSTATYTLDRWFVYSGQASKLSIQQNAGSVTPPTGFTKYLGLNSLTSYSVGSGDTFATIQQIEGLNTIDLDWGLSTAKPVTLSFWVRSSLTGSFGGSLTNNDGNKVYGFTYTINSANTWEYKTITVPGCTDGTWLKDTGVGIGLRFGLGSGSTYTGTGNTWSTSNIVQPTGTVSVVGTSGATWYVTGVQLEKGSQATAFDWRDYGRELQLCQRYYEKSYDITMTPGSTPSNNEGVWMFRGSGVNSRDYVSFQYKQTKRASPTVTIYSVTGASGNYRAAESSTDYAAQINGGGVNSSTMQSNSTAPTNQQCSFLWTASAEL